MKDSPVPDLFGKISDESTALGKLAGKIPGFDGYIERSRRREADQLLRQTIASRIEAIRVQLGGVHQELSRDILLAMEYAEPLGEVDTRLMGLAGKVKDAPQGYAGFFDAVKIKEEDLARVYAFDAGMMDFVDQLAAEADALNAAVIDGGDIGAAIRTMSGTAREANANFNTRTEVLMGIG
ncbi:MAG: hypothetical protein KC418_19505 [Anaerolineales bacterium]|nr:hypothetical protein [Anaerolineales bacterium]MCB8951298.1 hypothetical protein [Ardenticatenales bacterium]